MSEGGGPVGGSGGDAGRGGLRWRGLVEGFYGEPWSHDDRLAWFAFGAPLGLDRYLYAPKDDPWHRELWREPYPEERLAAIASLVSAAAEHGVRFVYAISPGLDMRYDDPAEHDLLAAKCRQLMEVGVRSFSLLFDDVPLDDPLVLGRAHGDAAARLVRDLLLPAGIDEPLLFCPTDYAGIARTPYREGLAATLPADALVLWTGADIVVGEVTADDIAAARESFDRDLVLWDNFPVNDFDRSRVFLGPLTGRSAGAGPAALVGIAANPMVEAAPSRFALATVAEWAADPAAYAPDRAADRAFAMVAGGGAGLRALVAACSAWPPSAPRWPALDAAVDAQHWEAAEALLADLAATSAEGAPADLARQLAPWLRAADAAGSAGVLACQVLRRADDAPSLATLLDARRRLEAEFADVARTAILALVDRAVADLGGAPAADAPAGSGALVAIVTGPNPSPGDRELAEFLRAAGYRARVGDHPDAELLIVTRAATEEAARVAASRPVPVLAWAHLVAMGLAGASAVPLSVDRIAIADGSHPAAAGLAGSVNVYRGRSKLTWAEPSAAAAVIAREPESGRAAISFTPAGAPLADGSTAPAPRATFFLSTDGFAPWLVTPEARALLLATVREVLAGR